MASSNKPSLGQIAQKIFEDALQNIIHDIVITQHREHKLMLASLDPVTKLPHCEQCKLPCLLDPPLAPKVRSTNVDPPKDTQYCEKRPWSRRPGHDIYDNPFLKADSTGRPPTKKEREAAKNSKKGGVDGDGTPVSEEPNQNGTGPPSPSENGEGAQDRKLEKGEKKASKIDEKLKKGEYIPWHTCPSCKRSLLITRFAKHLEQCMGLSGRAASRNAMAKMSSTPAGSRSGTPNPQASQEGKDNDDEDDDLAVKGPGGVRKKLLKKGLNQKIKKEKGVNGKLPKGLAAKRPPGSGGPGGGGSGGSGGGGGSPAPSGVADKRDRDEMLLGDEGDDEENVHVKKRQKISRVGSTASIASQSTAAPGMEREGSGDGSFVDEGSGVED